MKLCATCIYWKLNPHTPLWPDYGACWRAGTTEGLNDHSDARAVAVGLPDSGYGLLATAADFGCVDHEERG